MRVTAGRAHRYNLFLNEAERAALDKLAGAAGLSAADWVRQLIRRELAASQRLEEALDRTAPGDGEGFGLINVRTDNEDTEDERRFWERWEKMNPGRKRPG